MIGSRLLSAMAGAEEKLYSDDVFSTYLYTGNGATQTIINGIDLAGKGGLVWLKTRGGPFGTADHFLFDTVRGTTSALVSNSTSPASTVGGSVFPSFNSNGFSIGSSANSVNYPDNTYTSWTFRKAPKFFDCGTYTGDGNAGR